MAQIEAKRWEFCEALVVDAQRQPQGTLDPLETGRRIGLHEIHAREFFISLVSSGHLNRDWLTAEWQELARRVDSDDRPLVAGTPIQEQPRIGLDVFLCHASEDKEAVRELRNLVQRWGHEPWLDEEKILPGQDWDLEIRRAVQKAHVVLVCLSERSEKRGYLQKEMRRALDIADEQPEGSIFLIPIRLTNCSVPERWRRWQWVDLFAANGPNRLEAALRQRAAEETQTRGGPTRASS